MRYIDTFSGIGSASVAWRPLGWECVAHAEIAAFPSAVLKHRFPLIPNLGDCALHAEWPDYGPVDLVCGGTPCQSFSVAGLRAGLADPRGNLSLTYLAIVDQFRPRWLVWENVPGVLSHDKGRTFASIIGALGELGYGWAYRVLDAQFVRVDGFPFAVPQRRRRLYVVGYIGDWRRAAAVLFERESLQGYHPPRRRSGQSLAAATVPSLVGSGRGVERIGESRGQDPVVAEVANCLTERMHKGVNTTMDEGQTMIPVAVPDVACTMPSGGNETGGDRPPGTGQETAAEMLIPVIAIQERAVSENTSTIDDGRAAVGPDGKGWRDDGAAYTLESREAPQAVAYGIRSDAGRSGEAVKPSADAEGKVRLRDAGFNIYEDLSPTLDATAPHTVAFTAKDSGHDLVEDVSPTLRSGGHDQSHANAGVMPAVMTLAVRGRGDGRDLETRDDGTANAILTPNGGRDGIGVGAIAFDTTQITSPDNYSNPQAGDPVHPLAATAHPPAIAFPTELSGTQYASTEDVSPALSVKHSTSLAHRYAVRRLMPIECERLQGLEDDWTNIPWRGKGFAPDGPRYKAIGNGWAINLARWIGTRIQMVDELAETLEAAE
jgi:DNA (cytosine-5)-methyltransferase 1